jgi:hypothetical protein
MATFMATTASNGPRVKDAAAAQEILDRYVWEGDVIAVIRTDEQPYLAIYGYDWPGAWRVPDGVRRQDFEPDYNIDGGEGFEEFLNAVSPFLAEPLTVQCVGTENCRFPISACEWHVKPGASEIETNGFKHSLDETISASV